MKYTIINDYKESDYATHKRIKRRISNYLQNDLEIQALQNYLKKELDKNYSINEVRVLTFFLGYTDENGNKVGPETSERKSAKKLIIKLLEQGSDLKTFKDELRVRSFSYFYDKYGFSKYNVNQLIKGYNLSKPSKEKYGFRFVLKTLKDKHNIDDKVLYDYYITKKYSLRELQKLLSQELGYNISITVLVKILEAYNIKTSDRK